ncbi:MAG: toluene tolerance protein, partial [Gammaproteobacteria bacterium]|nr:toluene tolerance protein [Gammaproteobacteria bacterium]
MPLQFLMAALLCLCTVLPSAAQNPDAIATVDNLHAALLDIMRNADSLGFAGRRDQIAPVIRESLDLPFIAR